MSLDADIGGKWTEAVIHGRNEIRERRERIAGSPCELVDLRSALTFRIGAEVEKKPAAGIRKVVADRPRKGRVRVPGRTATEGWREIGHLDGGTADSCDA